MVSNPTGVLVADRSEMLSAAACDRALRAYADRRHREMYDEANARRMEARYAMLAELERERVT